MAVKVISATHNGLKGFLIEVEVDISKGLPQFIIVGLPDESVKEAKERVRSAIINSGYEFPLGRITINLAPADVRKIGSLLDLPIAIGILMESEQIINKTLNDCIVFGELSLFGQLKRVKGTIPIVIEGINENINKFIFPYENVYECSYLKGENYSYYPFKNLKEVIDYITYEDVYPYEGKEIESNDESNINDYGSIIGQYTSKRALEIAAAGKHNIILYGEPGCGKTMLAKALISIIPDLSSKELIEVAEIYSACGLMDGRKRIIRPFRSPHHTSTKASILGGGRNIKPGEITLAHNGILFLDEILEFKKEVLEALREPLEEKYVNINRLNETVKLPADFLLVGAFNPTERKDQNAYLNDEYYSDLYTRKYRNKFSSALLDRIDIFNYVPRVDYKDIKELHDDYDSEKMKRNVMKAWKMQKKRFVGTGYKYNSEINGKDIFELCKMTKKCSNILEYYYNSSNVSLRGYGKVIKLARTIADIEEKCEITEEDILEAISYRKNINGEII